MFSVMFIIVFGAIGLVVFWTATLAGVFQRKIKQNGLTGYSQWVKRMVDSGELVVVTEKDGEEGEEQSAAAE